MSRRGARVLAGLALAICLLSAAAAGAGPAERPYEAPLLGANHPPPPLPPEYLSEKRDGIRFAYHPSARDRARALIDAAPDVRRELREQLGDEVLRDLDVRVTLGGSDFVRVLPAGAPVGSSVVVLAEHAVVVLAVGGGMAGAAEPMVTLRRGMALLALDEASGRQPLPRWFYLGYAVRFSGEGSLARQRALWWAAVSRQLVAVADLDWRLDDRVDHGTIAAAEAADFVRFLVDDGPVGALPVLVEAVRNQHSFEQAVRMAYQTDRADLERRWRRQLARNRVLLPVLFGTTLLFLVVALAVRIRRRRARIPVIPAVGHPAAVHDGPGRHRRALPRRKRVRIDRLASVDPPDPGVPKVSHDGRWHTLH